MSTIIYTRTDESPLMATYSLKPIVEAYAKAAGKTDALKPLQEALKDSKAGDEKFNKIAESSVNPAAAKAA